MTAKDKVLSLFLIVLLCFIAFNINNQFHELLKELNSPVEWNYKGFSDNDINLAMKFHGCLSVTITEKDCYFINKNKK